jgi:DNA-binding MarR family transcriptional regulator
VGLVTPLRLVVAAMAGLQSNLCASVKYVNVAEMGRSTDERGANLLATLSLVLCDRVRHETEQISGHASAAPAALVALREFLGGGSIDDLRTVVGLTPSGAVRLVDRLEADGYVRRRPGLDRRSVALVLTPRGRVVARRVAAARSDAVSAILAPLTDEERSSLTRIVERLLSAVVADRMGARDRGLVPSGGWACRMCDFAACGRSEGRCPVAASSETSPRRSLAPAHANLTDGRSN